MTVSIGWTTRRAGIPHAPKSELYRLSVVLRSVPRRAARWLGLAARPAAVQRRLDDLQDGGRPVIVSRARGLPFPLGLLP